MEQRDVIAGEVARYDGLLRRRAATRAVADGDATLSALLASIAERRARRTGPRGAIAQGGQRAVVPSSAGDGEQAAAGSTSPGAAATAGASPQRSGPAGRVLAIDTYGPTVRVLHLGRPAGLSFRPGQYVKAGVPGGKRTSFSAASAPHDQQLALAVELRAGGRVTPALFALRVGDAVEVDPVARGSLRLDPVATHHLMVATVTGIAPLRSMVRAALHDGTAAAFTILLGASHAVELPFHEELTALAAADRRVTYQATVSRPGEPGDRPWIGAVGRVDALAADVARRLDPANTHVYAVGHAGMIASVRDRLGGAGFPVSVESYGS